MSAISAIRTPSAMPLAQTYAYAAYSALCEDCAARGSTTGSDQSESLVNYTKLNWQRMKRVEQTCVLTDDVRTRLASLAASRTNTSMTWLVLTEAWCGDAAQIVPVLDVLAQTLSANSLPTQVLCVLRDENLPLMDAFLTNNARAIPKVLFLRGSDNRGNSDNNGNSDNSGNAAQRTQFDPALLLGSWGPRPTEAQAQLTAWKAEGLTFEEFAPKLHKWYADDKTVSTQHSVLEALEVALG
jgi:hypothetical protein